ncbi:MAG TPA: PepSY-like domain-containing protein [Daejeonella sp.]|nr:PepSY-like domain-containing protein [Daejeonella sp.]
MMKKTILAFLLMAGMTLGVKAQDQKTSDQRKEKDKVSSIEVPAAVQTSFSSNFANATDVKWKKKDADYKVSFEINDVDHHAMFSSTGTLIWKGEEIQEAAIPPAIITALKKDHPNYKIDDAYTIVKGGVTSYKITLDGNPDLKVMYSADGTKVQDKVNQ